MNKKWPNDYPKHILVPPENAMEISDHLFRIVGKCPPDKSDFLASYKDPNQKGLSARPHIRNKPGFYGTSFFKEFADVEHVINGNPERFKGQLIAKGDIIPDHGKGEYSRNTGHVSIWFYEGVYPEGFERA